MSYNYETKKYEGYIYIIKNSINEKLYIGQCSTTLYLRWCQHKCDAKSDRFKNMILYKAMRKYGIENFYMNEIESLEADTHDDLIKLLDEREIYNIATFNTLMPNGYNMTIGGSASSERIKNRVKCYFRDGTYNRTFNSITEAALEMTGKRDSVTSISRCCKGLAYVSLNRIWRYEEDDLYKYPFNNSFEKGVIQMDLDGNELNTFQSVSEALRVLGINRNEHIQECCRGERESAFGYKWKYLKIKRDYGSLCKPIDRYTKDGVLVETFRNKNELAEKHPDYSIDYIQLCCRGHKKSAYDSIWRYHDDDFSKHDTDIIDKRKTVLQYSLDGELLATYDSVTEAGKIFSESKSAKGVISSCCTGRTKTAYGYIWKFAEQ